MTPRPALSPLDTLLQAADGALRTVFGAHRAGRPCPQPETPAEAPLDEGARKLSGALMRVNHVGEVCAQALYTAQALATRDPVSLGFVVETERQVEQHLESHLDRLPAQDTASRAIVQQMKEDEARHALDAEAAGATPLPAPVQWLMRGAAKVMTTTAHHV
jgi:3-demethoxyubiquinol 3-hydroxylase